MANPYLNQQANAITSQVTNNLQRNILPGINSGAMAAGGYGGSRQGIVQANAIGQTNQDLSNALANLRGNAYQFDQQNQTTRDLGFGNLALQNRSLDVQNQTQRDLGLGNLALQNRSLDVQNQTQRELGLGNLYTQNRSLDQSGLRLGADLYSQANQGYLGQGQGIYNVGNTMQQAPWYATQQALQGMSPFSGLGGTTTSQQGMNPIANGLGGAIGGWQLGSNLYNLGFGG